VTDEHGLSGETPAEILIVPVNDPPVALDEYASVSANKTLVVDLLENDAPIAIPFSEFYDIYEADSSDVLSVVRVVSGPFHGSVSLGADRESIEYKPESYTFIGGDSLTYEVCDSGHPSLCTTATLFIDVTDNDFAFKIYEGVSPNNDGLNDYLRIDGIHRYKKNLVRIFDRFNNLVCEIADYDNEGNRWHGQSNRGLGGSRLPDGTYFYTVYLNDNRQLYSGYVILKEQ
jgi:gliding motility-associated-like protein